MKILLMLYVSFLACAVSKNSTPSKGDFDWMLGKWERQGLSGKRSGFEYWRRQSDGNYAGQGVTLENGDTSFIENLEIRLDSDTWYYIAEVPHNPAPVKFKVTDAGPDSFLAENPDHDFPKKISYSLRANVLSVRISAGDQEVDFTFSKLPID